MTGSQIIKSSGSIIISIQGQRDSNGHLWIGDERAGEDWPPTIKVAGVTFQFDEEECVDDVGVAVMGHYFK